MVRFELGLFRDGLFCMCTGKPRVLFAVFFSLRFYIVVSVLFGTVNATRQRNDNWWNGYCELACLFYIFLAFYRLKGVIKDSGGFFFQHLAFIDQIIKCLPINLDLVAFSITIAKVRFD
jgi:phosphoglycerol transferase MdoB-like AlkP superfamily enzyme